MKLLHSGAAGTGLSGQCYPKCWSKSRRSYTGDRGKDCFIMIQEKQRKRKTHLLAFGQYVLFHTNDASALTLKVNQKPGANAPWTVSGRRCYRFFFLNFDFFFLAVHTRGQYYIVYLYFSSPKQICSYNWHHCGFPAAHLHPAGVHRHLQLEVKEQT